MQRRFLILWLFLAVQVGADWRVITPGVEYQRVERGTLDVHVTRIDLRNPAVRVIATTEQERGLTVSEYARKTDAIVAINADYFDPELRPIGKSLGACGLWSSGGKVGRQQGLVAVGKGRAEIQRNTQRIRRWMTGAVSGWPMLVENCEVLTGIPGSDHFTRAPHPRTAAGLSRDRKTLYLVVADGRREGVPGPTLPELAAFLHELGACSAMNLDGGGSSAFWLEDSIVNQPSDAKERRVANHLAVVAASDYSGCRERKAKR